LHSLLKIPNKLDNSSLQLPNSYEKVLPFVKQAPRLELKSLPKYLYLGETETLPVIIANDLTEVREDKLLRFV
jgi:hypothetical protein